MLSFRLQCSCTPNLTTDSLQIWYADVSRCKPSNWAKFFFCFIFLFYRVFPLSGLRINRIGIGNFINWHLFDKIIAELHFQVYSDRCQVPYALKDFSIFIPIRDFEKIANIGLSSLKCSSAREL